MLYINYLRLTLIRSEALFLCLWKEALLDELFCDLDSVGCCTLAEVVSHAPEVEAGLD